jgi:predicted short-subunit dehydrogenase-like oxidoreductase (DUF2520 family)
VKTIAIIGCGKVGKTLGRLWTRRNLLEVRSILNRSAASSGRAAEFVGAGRAAERYEDLDRADLVMISTPDEAIEACCGRLCASGALAQRAIVFHCSGALSSASLDRARAAGAAVASLHPVKSFADPAAAAETFSGTFCAVEGDPPARDALGDLVRRCGAIPFPIESEHKTIYHAGTVVVCNYLVALMEVGLRCFEKAGLDRDTAVRLIEPIVRETVGNVFRLGVVGSLTGPIARGEASIVRRQSEALGQWDAGVQRIYKDLGLVAAELAAGRADPASLAAIVEALDEGAEREGNVDITLPKPRRAVEYEEGDSSFLGR